MRTKIKSYRTMLRKVLPRFATVGILVAATMNSTSPSCFGPDQVVASKVVITPAPSVSGPLAGLQVAYLEGYYLNCQDHNPAEKWSAKVSAWPGLMPTGSPSPISIDQDDTNCKVYLHDVVFNNAQGTLAPLVYLSTTPDVAIPDAYPASSPLSFQLILSPQRGPDFVGNIRLVQPDVQKRFGQNFELDFTYRNDQIATSNGTIVYVLVQGTPVTASAAAAPDYQNPDFTLDHFLIGLDANHMIVSLSGDVQLTAPTQQGETWIYAPNGIVHSNGVTNVPGSPNLFDDVQYSYNLAASTEILITQNQPLKIQPSQLGFVLGETVSAPVTKWFIVKHHDSNRQVDTFESLSVLFTPPTP